MKRILLLFFAFLITGILTLNSYSRIVLAADRRSDPNKLSIMTFNAEFLWDGRIPEDGDRRVNFPWKNSPTKADAHMQDIADVIKGSNPDIVNLVEVESLPALRFFNDNFLAGLDYEPYLVNGQDTFTGQDVALLTRIDPEGNRIERTNNRVRVAGESRTRGVSKNYFAKFDIGNRKFSLIGVHFLSRPTSTSRKPQREAQAEVIKNLALQLHNDGYLPIVLGDINDYEGEPSSIDVGDNIPITNVLSNIRQQASFTNSDDLINVMKFVPKSDRFTSFFDRDEDNEIDTNEFTAIDHILIPNRLEPLVETVSLDQSYDPREVSDHFPITITFDLARDGDGNEPIPTAGTLNLLSILPNPVGNDEENEAATLENSSSTEINLNGWSLRDEAGRIWNLSRLGTIDPEERLTVKRSGQPMAMNNSGGDTIELVDPDGTVTSFIQYLRTEEGVEIPA